MLTPGRASALLESSSPALCPLLLQFPLCLGPLLEIRFLTSLQGRNRDTDVDNKHMDT